MSHTTPDVRFLLLVSTSCCLAAAKLPSRRCDPDSGDLVLDKEIDSVFSLDFVCPKVRILDPTKRQVGMRSTDSDIDPDHAGIGF